jgi:hypothetical protein
MAFPAESSLYQMPQEPARPLSLSERLTGDHFAECREHRIMWDFAGCFRSCLFIEIWFRRHFR